MWECVAVLWGAVNHLGTVDTFGILRKVLWVPVTKWLPCRQGITQNGCQMSTKRHSNTKWCKLALLFNGKRGNYISYCCSHRKEGGDCSYTTVDNWEYFLQKYWLSVSFLGYFSHNISVILPFLPFSIGSLCHHETRFCNVLVTAVKIGNDLGMTLLIPSISIHFRFCKSQKCQRQQNHFAAL